MQAASCILCATPRSGSTLLCDLLAATGVAGRPESYFRRQSEAWWAARLAVPGAGRPGGPDFARYLDAVRRAGEAGTGIFALRLMWGSVGDLAARLAALDPDAGDDAALFSRAFGAPLYVHLTRRDRVAQAVSRLRAEQTGLWHVAADGSERERAAPPAPPVYDRGAIAAYVAEAERDDACWDDWFARGRIAPLRIAYEDLATDPRATLARLLMALGRDPDRAAAVGPATSRMADALSAEWAERYRADAAG